MSQCRAGLCKVTSIVFPCYLCSDGSWCILMPGSRQQHGLSKEHTFLNILSHIITILWFKDLFCFKTHPCKVWNQDFVLSGDKWDKTRGAFWDLLRSDSGRVGLRFVTSGLAGALRNDLEQESKQEKWRPGICGWHDIRHMEICCCTVLVYI